MSSKNKLRLFEVNKKSVNQVLFCNDSDMEDALALDDGDLGFLEDDLDQLDLNAKNDDDPVAVYIEPPQRHDLEKTLLSGQQLNRKKVEELQQVHHSLLT